MRRARPTRVPPFRQLDPVLAQAETLLAQGELADVVAALPDEPAAATRLNTVLMHAGARLHLRYRDGRWQAGLVGRSGEATQRLTAAEGLVLLVVADGWRRVKRCDLCGAAFIDRTNGCSRRRCGIHRRSPPSPKTGADPGSGP
jgi:hypothetical protein